MKNGEEKAITVTFPAQYQNEELAGKEASFDITVKKIQAPELPAIDEEFVKKFGVKGGVDSFEGEIKENMERELKFIVQRKIKDQVFNGLREVSEFEVPKALIQREIEASKQKLLKQMGVFQIHLNQQSLHCNHSIHKQLEPSKTSSSLQYFGLSLILMIH